MPDSKYCLLIVIAGRKHVRGTLAVDSSCTTSLRVASNQARYTLPRYVLKRSSTADRQACAVYGVVMLYSVSSASGTGDGHSHEGKGLVCDAPFGVDFP